jgi:hypothetical protein
MIIQIEGPSTARAASSTTMAGSAISALATQEKIPSHLRP